ncbi:MAG TPA: ABC transporter ATP-binding protein [Stellaceae bacterium]|nr:ABC transporter ATP-binding protein [Stellaceae bacterium]
MNTLEVAIRRKAYRHDGADIVALAGLDFTVPAGQFACILGPSGCGKTTLLSIIAGLDRAYDGSVRRAAGERRLGMVFQTPRLLPWLSVRENVRLALEPPPRGEGRAEELLREMQLGALIDAFPRQLSGGQQRRVALARAFVSDPDLLLLDEPFQSLDAPTAQHLRELLLTLWARRRPTILFVTHDLREALSLGDRVLFLSAGPGRLVLDLPLDLPRPRGPDSAAVEALRKRLLESYPDLLRGLAASAVAESAA